MAPLSRTSGAGESVKVWDPLVRVFHWSLVCLFVFSFVTGDEWKRPISSPAMPSPG